MADTDFLANNRGGKTYIERLYVINVRYKL